MNFVLVYRLSEEGLSTAMSSFNTDDVLQVTSSSLRKEGDDSEVTLVS